MDDKKLEKKTQKIKRKKKYSFFFAKDAGFQEAVIQVFEIITGDKVGSIAENLYFNFSKLIHRYPLGGSITVRKSNFNDDELKLLKIICERVKCVLYVKDWKCLKLDVLKS